MSFIVALIKRLGVYFSVKQLELKYRQRNAYEYFDKKLIENNTKARQYIHRTN